MHCLIYRESTVDLVISEISIQEDMLAALQKNVNWLAVRSLLREM